MVNPIKQPTQNRIFPKLTVANKFAGLFVATIIIIGFLQVSGIINLRDMFLSYSDSEQSSVYNIPKEATIGVPYDPYDFSWMKPAGCFEPCHFETTAMEGFVPLGLQLWPDGILKGTPTGESSSFEVCVIDAVGKKSTCRKFNQNVSSKANTKTLTTKNPTSGSGVASTKSLADVWSGAYSYRLNFNYQDDSRFDGKFTLSFNRNGDKIQGSYTTYSEGGNRTENILGTIIGTQIKFNDDWCPSTDVQSSICMRFIGTISGNLLNLNAERCSFGNYCPSRYSTNVLNPPMKGTVTLTR